MSMMGTWLGLALVAAPATSAPLADLQADPCSIDQVVAGKESFNQLRLWEGNAKASNDAEALTLARKNANTAMMTALGCSDVPAGKSQRCDAVRAAAVSWQGKSRQVRRNEWLACTTVAVPASLLPDLDTEVALLETNLQALAGQVARAANGRTIAILTPVWHGSGCAAGVQGQALALGLQRAIGAVAPSQDLLLGGGRLPDDGRRVLLELAERQGRVAVAASVIDDRCTGASVGGFDFPSLLMGIPEGESGHCATDPLLGTTAYGTCGPDLRVDVDMPDTDAQHVGTFCAGEVLAPRIRVSQPARVQVFQVDATGTAELLFPADGASDLVEDELSLGEFDAVYSPTAGEERLVAIAVPVADRFGTTDGWTGACRVPGTWQPSWIPAGAALGRSTFVILPPSHASCSGVPASRFGVEGSHTPSPRCGP